MSFDDLKRTFIRRRMQLIKILQEADANRIDLGKQHQIYGAVKEIENFLHALNYVREMEIQDKDTFSLKRERKNGMFKEERQKKQAGSQQLPQQPSQQHRASAQHPHASAGQGNNHPQQHYYPQQHVAQQPVQAPPLLHKPKRRKRFLFL